MHSLTRIRLHITGQVQGVGFRPYVYRLATEERLAGSVQNDPTGVIIELQGPPETIARFTHRLQSELPPLAKIETVTQETIATVEIPKNSEFKILNSEFGPSASAAVTPDTTVCPDCLRELFDPTNRRHAYGLINCTNCGPRFTIIQGIPYDRPLTTMAPFPMCPACAAEYANPADRRFHAQPTCCPTCGPKIWLEHTAAPQPPFIVHRSSFIVNSPLLAPYSESAALLLANGILAIKGLGGFHLACRADSPTAVARLRQLKRRDTKPFALMVADLAAAKLLVDLSPTGQAEITSPRRPIVLAPKRTTPISDPQHQDSPQKICDEVAPNNHRLGIMLPYTPIQYLLFAELAKLGPIPPLVMTSGNISDEPIAYENDEARRRLAPLCDAFLLHDRPIARAVDDSIYMDRSTGVANFPEGPFRVPCLTGEGPRQACFTNPSPEKFATPHTSFTLPIRRSRGYAPVALRLGATAIQKPQANMGGGGLCVGGELKNTIAVVRPTSRGHEVILSQHLGDLENALAYEHFQRAIEDLIKLFDVRPQWIAHDLHPAYTSTRYAQQLAAKWNVPLIPVQHHHAHAAAVFTEHNLLAQGGLALVCDGTGYGTDGTIWGGEILHLHPGGKSFTRLAHLSPMRLAGGDAAAKDTRRPALAMLYKAYGESPAFEKHAATLIPDAHERSILLAMIRRGSNSPWTTSTGRLFDGFAALLGVCNFNHHEAASGMLLESLATSAPQSASKTEKNDAKALQNDAKHTQNESKLSPNRSKSGPNESISGALFTTETLPDGTREISLAPLIRSLMEDLTPRNIPQLSYQFHATLAAAFAESLQRAATQLGTKTIGLSGGVMCNAMFSQLLRNHLEKKDLQVIEHRLVPPTDAGLSYGQAAAATTDS